MTKTDPIQLERHTFIDFLLLFKGRFNRAELVKRFGVGSATASRLIATYIESHPNVVEFQSNSRGYFATNGFTPDHDHNTLDGLEYVASGVLTNRLDVDHYGADNYHLQRPLEARRVAAITRAIINGHIVNMEYLATGSGSTIRNVVPHALFNASGCWYFRAYDTLAREFNTFQFSRVMAAIDLGTATNPQQSGKQDSQWHQMRRVQLMPHPKNPQPNALVADFGLEDSAVRELMIAETRLGLVLTELRVDCSKTRKLCYQQYLFALKNREELEDIDSMQFAPGF